MQADDHRPALPRRIPRPDCILAPHRPRTLHGVAHPRLPARGGRHPNVLRPAPADVPRDRADADAAGSAPARRRDGEVPTLFKYRTATLQDVLDDHLTTPSSRPTAARCGRTWRCRPRSCRSSPTRSSSACSSTGRRTAWAASRSSSTRSSPRVERNGGELVVHSAVDDDPRRERQGAGVELEGGASIRTPLVVSNADARHTFDDLIGLRRAAVASEAAASA